VVKDAQIAELQSTIETYREKTGDILRLTREELAAMITGVSKDAYAAYFSVPVVHYLVYLHSLQAADLSTELGRLSEDGRRFFSDILAELPTGNE
jgi:ribosomal protein L6P/L9E